MSLYKEIMKEMKKRGLIRPKRQGPYVPRVQLVAKVEEETQIKVILLAYEHQISVGELLENLVLEFLNNKALIKKCVSKKRTRGKYGHHLDGSIYAHPGNQHARKNYSKGDLKEIDRIINTPSQKPDPKSEKGKKLAKLRKTGRKRRRSKD